MFSQDECVASVSDFYDFLGRMFMDVPSSVIYPPSGGWPNMTSEVMARLGKNEKVISLLRQLPYPEDRPYSEHPDCLSNQFRFQDWKTTADRLKDGKCDKEDALFETEGDIHRFGNRIPSHCVGLLHVITERGDGIDNVMLLNVEDGLVYWMDCPKHILEACEPKPSGAAPPLEGDVAAEDDKRINDIDPGVGTESDDEALDDESGTGTKETPPTSNDGDEDEEGDSGEEEEEVDESDGSDFGDIKWGPSWPVQDFFAMLKNLFVKLNYIPYNHRAVIDIWTDETPSGLIIPEGLPRLLQSVYRKHGWPDLEIYKKEDCLAELKQVLESEYPNFH